MNKKVKELWTEVCQSDEGIRLWKDFSLSNNKRDEIYRGMFAELILKEVFNACNMCEPQANPEHSLCEMFGIDHNWRLLDER